MPFIARQVKAPARLALTCKVPEAVATLLKQYAEFLDSSQEYVITETLRLAFRRDKEFHAWLAATHPETALPATESLAAPTHTRPAPSPTAPAARRLPAAPEPPPHQADHTPLVREERARP